MKKIKSYVRPTFDIVINKYAGYKCINAEVESLNYSGTKPTGNYKH